MRSREIINNYIYSVVQKHDFKSIYIYGSKYLELEKIINKLTSSQIVGGDVDFYNGLMGKYFTNPICEMMMRDDIREFLKLDREFHFSNLDILTYSIIFQKYNSQKRNINNERIKNNVVNNLNILVEKTQSQLKKIKLKLTNFYEENLLKFIERVPNEALLIIDNREQNHFDETKITDLLERQIKFIIISTKEADKLPYLHKVKAANLNIYSNIIGAQHLYINNNFRLIQKSFDTFSNEEITNVEIRQLNLEQFNSLRQKYLSKRIHYLGTPKISFGLFFNDKIFGAFGLTNDYRNKAPKIIEQPAIYLLSDFVVNSTIKKLSKLVLYCILSKEVKLLAERLSKRQINSIFTNVFSKNQSSTKYRDLFQLINRKKLNDDMFNLTYAARIGKWNLKEGLKLWKQKLSK